MEEVGCKSCSENVKIKAQISQEQIDEAVQKLSRIKKIKLVDDKVYANRLSKCQVCKYLEFGVTCLQCGCIVQIRAKLADAGCPLPKQKGWGAESKNSKSEYILL